MMRTSAPRRDLRRRRAEENEEGFTGSFSKKTPPKKGGRSDRWNQYTFTSVMAPGYVSMFQAMQKLGVTRQTVLQRVKRGELDAIHIRAGRKKALRINVEENQLGLFGDPA